MKIAPKQLRKWLISEGTHPEYPGLAELGYATALYFVTTKLQRLSQPGLVVKINHRGTDTVKIICSCLPRHLFFSYGPAC